MSNKINASKHMIAERLEHLETVFREAGIKVTHQRIEIFREVAKAHDHPDAETVHRRVSKRLSRLSLDTVYRTLWLLRDLALINTLGTPQERARFDANTKEHHHFICTECGLTQDFYCKSYDLLKAPITPNDMGTIESTHVEARGICHKCQSRKKSKKQNN